jgi:hypothetical protein
MKKMQQKSKRIQIYKIEHKLPLKPSHRDGKHQVRTQEGSNQNTTFLNGENHTPREAKANKNKCQTQTKTPTPPKIENTKFYQLSLDKPQDKIWPLK